MGHLGAPPKTAADFRAAGVVFRSFGGRYTCAGPKGRRDLVDALRDAIAWRVDAMRPHVRGARWPLPRIVLVSPTPPPFGACGCCGEPLPPYRGGDCELCSMALLRARDAEKAAR